MNYKIAVASSDQQNIDQSFGAADGFYIYEAADREFHLLEFRAYVHTEAAVGSGEAGAVVNPAASGDGGIAGCNSSGCGTGVGCGSGGGCGGAGSGAHEAKLALIDDCRCLICKKIGFGVQKQLEKKAITAFDIECPIAEGLEKIVDYLYKIDHHISLRGIQRNESSAAG